MFIERLGVSLAVLSLVAAAYGESLFLGFGPGAGRALEGPVRDLHPELDG